MPTRVCPSVRAGMTPRRRTSVCAAAGTAAVRSNGTTSSANKTDDGRERRTIAKNLLNGEKPPQAKLGGRAREPRKDEPAVGGGNVVHTVPSTAETDFISNDDNIYLSFLNT